MKKIFAMVLIMVTAASACGITVGADVGVNTIIEADFESAPEGFANDVSAYVKKQANDPGHTGVLALHPTLNWNGNSDSPKFWARSVNLGYNFNSMVENRAVTLSFQIKTNFADAVCLQVNWKKGDTEYSGSGDGRIMLGSLLSGIGLTTDASAWAIDETQECNKTNMTADKWYQIDLKIDQIGKKITLCIDGVKTAEKTLYTDLEAFKNIGLSISAMTKDTSLESGVGDPNVYTMIDNYRIAYDSYDDFSAEVSEDSGIIDVEFTNTVKEFKNIAKEDIKVRCVRTSEYANISNAEFLTGKMLRIQTESLASGEEYEIIYAGGFYDVFGKNLNDELTFNTINREGIYSSDFSANDFNSRSDVTYANSTTSAGDYGILDVDNNGNNVLRHFNTWPAFKWKQTYLELPSDTPDEYTLNVNYKARMDFDNYAYTPSVANSKANVTLFNFGIKDSNASVSYGPGFRFTGSKDSSVADGLYYYSSDKTWAGGTATKIAATDSGDTFNQKWYNFSLKYHVDGVNRITADYRITDEAGDVLLDISGVNTENSTNGGLKDIQYLCIIFNVEAADTVKTNALVDDLDIFYTFNKDGVKNVRAIDLNDNVLIPQATMPGVIKRLDIAYEGAAINSETISAALKETNGDGTKVAATDNIQTGVYSIALENFLKPATQYTLTVSNTDSVSGETEDIYTYTFTTSAEELIVSDFRITKAGSEVSLGDIEAGDELTISATVYNPSGNAEKTACLIYGVYNNGFLTDIKFLEKSVDISVSGTQFSLPILVEDINNLEVKGFIWDSIQGLKPLTNYIEITAD